MRWSLLLLLSFSLACGDDGRVFTDASFDASPADAAGDADGAAADASTDTGASDASADTGAPVDGVSIVFDYRFDTDGFFDDPARRTTLELAAAAWGRILADDFETVPAGTSLLTRDPQRPADPGMNLTIDEDIDDLYVFVGCSMVDGGIAQSNNTAALGTVSDPALQARLIERYQGADFEPWTGWISFDCDEPWFFDDTPETEDDIPPAMNDFYSTAMHEMGHVLGFGTADAFEVLVDDAAMTYTGAAAVAAYGGPVPLSASLAHWDSSLRSDGRPTLMDPSRTVGTRTPPTTLDKSAFTDFGYEVR